MGAHVIGEASTGPAAAVRTYLHRLLVERDLSVCEEMLSPTYVDHDAPAGTPAGPALTRAYVAALVADHPDLRFTINHLLAYGRLVAVHATWTGTHRDSGAALHRTGLLLIRLDEAGRIAERWSSYRDAGPT